jgi:hypothetical protein
MQEKIIPTKSHIAFYASTPSYKVVLDVNGWGEIGARLSEMAREGQWNEMWKEISDDMLEQIAIVGLPDELPARIQERYGGVADRICFGWESSDAQGRAVWQTVAKALAAR